ncbi:MAG: response regulator [Halobacteriales archaeon]|nr:response regulator [Halobacteriales archaeon]
MTSDEPTVLVVDDEPDVLDLYAHWLSESFTVRTADSGQAALDNLDETVSVVLLDRRMPTLSGDEVLQKIRDRGLNCRVAMVTAVEPDFDILEMGFDDYLVKPVSAEELTETVEKMLRRESYNSKIQDYFSLVSKKTALEAEKTRTELEANEEYNELESELETLQNDLSETLAELEEEDFLAAFHDLSGPGMESDSDPNQE